MSQKHREYGLRPNLITRAATIACEACPRCGTRQAVERRAGVFCVYCSTPVQPIKPPAPFRLKG